MILHYRNVVADAFRLLKRLTLRRAFNYLNIQGGYLYSRMSGKARVWAHPFSVSAETAAVCNLRCPECIAGLGQTRREHSRMELSMFQKALKAHSRHAFYANLYFQGEPFLNPRLEEMISHAAACGYYTSLSTNGHFLDPERCRSVIGAGLDRMIISLDGLTSESYTFYRVGGSLDRVVSGIRNLVAARRELRTRHPLIEIQFLVNSRNIHELPGLRQFVRELGADKLTLKRMQVYDDKGAEKFLPDDRRYNRYISARGGRKGRQALKRGPCYRLWSHAVYTSDGLLVPCCYDKVPEFPIGGLDQKKPEALWFAPGMNAFRQQVMDRREGIPICCNCDG
jgi:MoaA/NifB/PqqE/SkfB family radical SAM enzyme